MISSHTNSIHDICLPPYKKIKTSHIGDSPKYGDDSQDALDTLFYEFSETENVPQKESAPQDQLEDEINQALLSFNEYNENSEGMEYLIAPAKESQRITSISPDCSASNEGSPFDSPNSLTNSSVTSNEYEFSKSLQTNKKTIKDEPVPECDLLVPTSQTQLPASSTHLVTSPTQLVSMPSTTVNAATVVSIKQSMINTSKLTSLFTTLKVTYLKLCKEFNYLLTKFNENEKIKIELIQENNELKKLLTEIIKDRELDRKNFKRELLAEKELHKMCKHNGPKNFTSKRKAEE
jgi:hypothetical protein